MKLRESRVLKRLRAGKASTCMKLNLSDPRIVEICGLCGMDVVWLCSEHVPNDWLNLENQIRAAKLHDLDTIVRVGSGGYSDYIKPFEADATGIMVPHVDTADQAREVVDSTRFYPLGRRSLDGGNADGLFTQAPVKDYIRHCNQERFIILQIESPEAVENIDEIASIGGFDILLFGPADYSHQLGITGETDAPEVIKAQETVLEASMKHGKFAMVTASSKSFDSLVEDGYSIINLGADVLGLTQYTKELLNHSESEDRKPPEVLKENTVRSPLT